MDIDTYRKSPMSGELAELLRSPTLATAMQVAADSAPLNNNSNLSQIEHVAHIQHGIARGYALYPSVLKLLATPPEGEAEVEATYAEEKEK